DDEYQQPNPIIQQLRPHTVLGCARGPGSKSPEPVPPSGLRRPRGGECALDLESRPFGNSYGNRRGKKSSFPQSISPLYSAASPQGSTLGPLTATKQSQDPAGAGKPWCNRLTGHRLIPDPAGRRPDTGHWAGSDPPAHPSTAQRLRQCEPADR